MRGIRSGRIKRFLGIISILIAAALLIFLIMNVYDMLNYKEEGEP